MIADNNIVMSASYDHLEAALSVLIAVSASLAALDLAGRVTAANGWNRLAWLTGGAIAMGSGIWSMHFTAMLAFRLPVPVSYDWPTVLLSLLAGILTSAVALYVTSRRTMGPMQAATGSLTMGAGIAAMHYIGMAAMRLPAAMRFSPLLVALSVALAIAFSLAALLLAFDLREETRGTPSRKIVSSLAMGAGISTMHFTGMTSARFTPSDTPTDLSHAVNISSLETSGIIMVTLVITGLTILTSAVDRRFLAQSLELAVAKSSMALSEAARVAAMSEMSAAIAHEINQPLGATVTEASASLRWLALEPPALSEARESLARVIRNANRASDVVGRIGALLRKTPPPMRRLEVGEVILEALFLARSPLQERGIAVKTDLASEAPGAVGDRIQLQQLLLNLVMNAVDAMSTVTDRSRELVIRLSSTPHEVLVQVQDSGRGLDPEHAPHIFDPFFSTKPHGIGMGLSLCRSIVQMHGGRLWFTPNSPNGAIFQFTLRKAEKQHG